MVPPWCPGCFVGERGKGLGSWPPSPQPPLTLRKVSRLLNPASWGTLGNLLCFSSPITKSALVLVLAKAGMEGARRGMGGMSWGSIGLGVGWRWGVLGLGGHGLSVGTWV